MVRESDVDVIANRQDEKRFLDSTNIHLKPAVEEIASGLQLVLGSDIFTPTENTHETSMDKPLARIPPSVMTIIQCRAVEDGAEVSLILNAFTAEQRERVRDEVAGDARYGKATWINKFPNSLLWEFDGKSYSPSGLIEKMLSDLGFGDQSQRGTVYWRLPNSNSIKEEAFRLLP